MGPIELFGALLTGVVLISGLATAIGGGSRLPRAQGAADRAFPGRRFRGRRLAVRHVVGEFSTEWTELGVASPEVPIAVEVRPRGLYPSTRQRVTIDDAAFEARFEAAGTPAVAVRELLDEAARERLAALGRPRLSIRPGWTTLELPGFVEDPEQLVKAAHLLLDLALTIRRAHARAEDARVQGAPDTGPVFRPLPDAEHIRAARAAARAEALAFGDADG